MSVMHWCHADDQQQEPLQYTACGLDDVYLVSGYHWEETTYGRGLVIKDLDQLLKAISIHLALEKKTLCNKEVRFLRKQLDMTQSELGRYVGLSHQQVARWEKGESEITESAGAILRLLVIDHVCGRVEVRKKLDQIIETDATSQQQDRAMFKRTDEKGWQPALEAA